MTGHDIIVIGASAGGVEATAALIRALPADLPAALFVVVHFPPQSTSVLPRVLNRASHLQAHHALDGETIQQGHVYVAPPDWHMLIRDGHVELTRGPRENRHRPAIDPLFRTAALTYGARVIGVILSGTLDDGTAGLQAIKSRGGIAICQDPRDAIYPDMPRNAIEHVAVDHVAPLAELSALLTRLTNEEVTDMNAIVIEQTHTLEQEAQIAALDWEATQAKEPNGPPSPLACPSCGGVLWEMEEGRLVRYRCRVGHAFSPLDLLATQEDAVEEALWSALRALEERTTLLRRMRQRAEAANQPYTAQRFRVQEEEAQQRATLLHHVLQSGGLAVLANQSVQGNSTTPAEGEQ